MLQKIFTYPLTRQCARFVGVLLTPATIFVVYNTGGSLLKWHNNSEMRVKAMMTTAIHYNRISHQYKHDSVRALMLGSDMEQMYKLLTIRERGRRKYFALDGNYESFIYLTNDRNGEMALRLLCNSEKTIELNHILSEDLYSHDPGEIVENDAIDENGEPVLFAYDCDMPRITRFNSALTIHNRKGTLICFDFQKDVLRRFCADNVSIQSIDIKKFEARFFS